MAQTAGVEHVKALPHQLERVAHALLESDNELVPEEERDLLVMACFQTVDHREHEEGMIVEETGLGHWPVLITSSNASVYKMSILPISSIRLRLAKPNVASCFHVSKAGIADELAGFRQDQRQVQRRLARGEIGDLRGRQRAGRKPRVLEIATFACSLSQCHCVLLTKSCLRPSWKRHRHRSVMQ